MSASLDPDGTHGGPLLDTLDTDRAAALRHAHAGRRCPEQLQAAGVSWKVYYGRQLPTSATNVLPLLQQHFQTTRRCAARRPGARVYPGDFMADVLRDDAAAGLVGLRPIASSEHPPAPARSARSAAAGRSSALTAEPGAVGEDGAVHHLGRERRLLRPRRRRRRRRPGTPGEFLTGATLPDGRRGHPRADRPGLPRPAARRLAVQPRRLRLLRPLRPHLDAALPRAALRRRGARTSRLAAAHDRRPDGGLQLRPARPEAAVASARRLAPGPAHRLRRRGAAPGRPRAHARAGAGAGAAAVGPRGRPRPLGRQRRGPGHGQDAAVGQLADEELDALGVELGAGVAAQLFERLVGVERRAGRARPLVIASKASATSRIPRGLRDRRRRAARPGSRRRRGARASGGSRARSPPGPRSARPSRRPATGCCLIASPLLGVSGSRLRRMWSGIETLPTSWRIAAICSSSISARTSPAAAAIATQ